MCPVYFGIFFLVRLGFKRLEKRCCNFTKGALLSAGSGAAGAAAHRPRSCGAQLGRPVVLACRGSVHVGRALGSCCQLLVPFAHEGKKGGTVFMPSGTTHQESAEAWRPCESQRVPLAIYCPWGPTVKGGAAPFDRERD